MKSFAILVESMFLAIIIITKQEAIDDQMIRYFYSENEFKSGIDISIKFVVSNITL